MAHLLVAISRCQGGDGPAGIFHEAEAAVDNHAPVFIGVTVVFLRAVAIA
jgi:hypothetical protein